MSDLITAFLNDLTRMSYSPETIVKYQEVLYQFEEFCSEEKTNIESATKLNVRDFRKKLFSRGTRAVTVNGYTAVLKSFFEYQLKKGNRSNNPAKTIPKSKEFKSEPSFVPERELFKLIDQIDNDPYLTVTDVTMFELLLGTGMRVSEMCDLDILDIDEWGRKPTKLDIANLKKKFPNKKEVPDWIPGIIHIRKGKGSFARIIPFPKITQNVLKRFLAMREGQNFNSPLLFCNQQGGRMNRGNIYKRIRPILDTVKFLNNHDPDKPETKKKKGPHTLRHTYASLLINRGADIGAVRDLLGHRSVLTTQKYTHLEKEAMKRIHEKAHPKG